MSTLRIGWIGCGTHANEMLLPQLTRFDARIAVLCDIDEGSLRTTAARFGVAETDTTSDWRQLLARYELDALAIAAGPATHFEVGMAAVARRLPIFIEKPPAPDAARAQHLADAADAAGVPVVIGFMKRYSTANRIAANVIQGEAFGQPVSFVGQYMTAPSYFAGDRDYTGFYLHHCVHYFDLVPHLMGEVATVSARRHELAPGKLLLHVDFGFTSGGIGTLVVGTHQSRGTPMEWWQVMADHQRVEVRNVYEVRHYRNPPFKFGDPTASLSDGMDTLVWEPNLTAAANEDHKGYAALIADFLAAARGEVNQAPSAADGARAMTLLEQAIGN
jgi:myo-inositol 2-dehydrogenase/D-chiro-inositol 1-dehydrogenase